MAKTKTVAQTTYMWHSESNQQSAGSLERRCFCNFFILSHFLMGKDFQ